MIGLKTGLVLYLVWVAPKLGQYRSPVFVLAIAAGLIGALSNSPAVTDLFPRIRVTTGVGCTGYLTLWHATGCCSCETRHADRRAELGRIRSALGLAVGRDDIQAAIELVRQAEETLC